ncbi:hypothetical protein GCM10027416_06030 [Okibacterium endophyticum]
MYIGLSVVGAVILTMKRDRRYVLSLAVPAIIGIIALFFFLRSGQANAAVEGLPNANAEAISTPVLAIISFINIPDLWAGIFGKWGLGWLDTQLPSAVWVIGSAIFAAVVFLGLSAVNRRKVISFVLIFVCCWAIPTVLQTKSGAFVGEHVQPRYILPLLTLLAGFALLSNSSDRIRFTRVQRTAIALGLTFANSLALHTNIRRYTTGTDILTFNLDSHIEWWWTVAPSPMTIWILGTIAFGAVMLLLSRAVDGSGSTHFSVQPASTEPELRVRQNLDLPS